MRASSSPSPTSALKRARGKPPDKIHPKLGGRFGYFLLFLLGGGEGGVRGARRGGVSLKIPEGGASARRGRRGQRVSAGNCGGGGLNISVQGRNSHQESKTVQQSKFLSEHFPLGS